MGFYTKLKVQEGWATSKCVTEICTISEFLHGTRESVSQQQYFALLCVHQSMSVAVIKVIYYCSLGAWSCLRWDVKTDSELPTQNDVPGETALLASSLSLLICV